MLEEEKIGSRQLAVLVVMFTVGTSMLLVPGELAAEAKQDAWIASILGVGLGLLSVLLFWKLGDRFPDRTAAEYSELLLGKWLGKAMSVLFFSFCFMLSAVLLRDVGEFVSTQVLTETPIEFVHLLFLLIVVLGVRLGLAPIGRAAEIFFPWMVLLFLVVVGFLWPYAKIENLKPLMEDGFKPVLLGGVQMFTLQEYVIFLMILPFVDNIHKRGSAMLKGALVGGALVVIVTLDCILVLGPNVTTLYVYPAYVLAQKIDIGEFLSRIQIVVAGMWFLTIYFKTAVSFYASVVSLGQTLRLREHRTLVLPLAAVMLAIANIAYPNMTYYVDFYRNVWIPYGLVFMVVPPVILLTVSYVTGKKSPSCS
ncbi:spore gernimation protein [Cohnella pontilimi]|uniref:Spore gernimation protein n=1 Tax=Cohnella pontilimi TaxID=2564100 RepID=A0A4U0F9U4_9BACL|nr:endospore germination permease [Cohnella pontilimi]TJY41288.1 spore gernimation protein [Cohnella pontilimi]